MVASLGFDVPFRQTEVNHIYKSLLIFASDDEVVCLDITVKKALLLNSLKAVNNLDSNIKDRGQTEFLLAW